MTNDHQTPSEGLYHPDFEHDACGVGFICTLRGEGTHDVVDRALTMLCNLDHRGASGCDEATGDGSGILTQIPHAFLTAACREAGFDLPALGAYGAGAVFLPKDEEKRRYLMQLVESVIRDEKLQFLGWRQVPTENSSIGRTALEREPSIWQLFIGKGDDEMLGDAFERRLFILRKVLEHAIRKTPSDGANGFYICSLSSRTIVYKGMLTTHQLRDYFPDLASPLFTSRLALVHSRFSTNTMPQWALAQPFRTICHNGEINTLRGNTNWMNARQAHFQSPLFGSDIAKLLPLLEEGTSDSAVFDNAVEMLRFSGRPLPHAMMMMVPEAWEHHESMSDEKRAFYDYHSCLMEPWDGPATIPFTDGRYIGAVLDRNGLRPSRYSVTRDGLVVMSSETGVVEIDPADVVQKGRLQPGRMFLIDLDEGRIISDDEIKHQIASSQPYGFWLSENLKRVEDLGPFDAPSSAVAPEALHAQQQVFGYTSEDMRMLIPPMMLTGKEALGSMGDDTPLAVLSENPRMLYDYFRQLFAQVTNPPLDAIREEIVTSMFTNLGAQENVLDEGPAHCRQLRLSGPIVSNEALARIAALDEPGFQVARLSTLFPVDKGGEGLQAALDTLCRQAATAIDEGNTLLILSDRGVDAELAPIPALLAIGAVHHHLIRTGRRTRCSLLIESGEPREVHHFCLLIGYGADVVNPYLVLDAIPSLLDAVQGEAPARVEAEENYIHAVEKGVLKVMSKMGISTLQSYRGAQIFEAVGIGRDVIDAYFTKTPSRIGGISLDIIAEEVRMRHARAYQTAQHVSLASLNVGGRYQWRRNGEHHHFNPHTIARLQQAVRQSDPKSFSEFSRIANEEARAHGSLRGLLRLRDGQTPIPIEEVEPWTEIVKRFKTGAMSYGSISSETHETLAVAMNRLGGRSNTGEGGEHPSRYDRSSPNRSRIKQVASGRFGVTMAYLASADEIQIKMAQGAKPGEGGQLPGEKVYPWIAQVRHSTPYVGLISPPPHHDIYSIEDLAQLIFDLKNANPQARISVKLVSEVGVGTIAAGVAKGKADVILISGSDGGTGASPQTSIAHAGLPWELGLSETHQTLVRNGLRSRVKVECDGQLKTGWDVAVAALLGAEEFGFATAPLVAMGCIMMRKCHLNTCPVGIATQDPELRAKFKGEPEHVINFFHFVAEEVRAIMASLGIRTLDEMVGRVELLEQDIPASRWKASSLDLTPVLTHLHVPDMLAAFQSEGQDHGIDRVKDNELIARAAATLETGEKTTFSLDIENTDRAFGTMLSHAIVRRHGPNGLPDGTLTIHTRGSAGQSFGAFSVAGLTMRVEGDANDYFGKGLSGARLIVYPPATAPFAAEDNILIGNVALYGATSGEVFVRGRAGERFAVRNSGVRAVVEGIGDHGCEYMTGGRVVVLGTTGRNFGAGMSGGIAYVYDADGVFAARNCNMEMVDLEPVETEADQAELRAMIERHADYTGSALAGRMLADWDAVLPRFVKVMPVEYKRALKRMETAEQAPEASRHVAA
ncbi:MAG: glutamate synthase large subunit [Rhodothermales bacterium]